jgi:hypothetical protein
MTEAEWLSGGDSQRMLEVFFGQGRNRKLRLFACACVRRVAEFVSDRRSRIALEVAERFADGDATWEELQVAHHAAREATRRFGGAQHPAEFAARDAASAGAFAAAQNAARTAGHAARTVATAGEFGAYDSLAAAITAMSAAEQDQCLILRDIMGNPFRAPAIDPLWAHWNGATVLRLAQAIYAGRHFEDLPVLADALEEAGCQESALLVHCRGGGEHFRGCWVVDALLGKE